MIRTDVQLGWKSIPGHRHIVEGRENEDAVFISQEHACFDALMIVADGLGGHPEPRLAAQTAASAARDFLFRPEQLDGLAQRRADPAALLRRAVEHANLHVRRLAGCSSRGEKPPGSTLTVAAVVDGRFAAAHVGDGSVFLFRDGRLMPLAGGEARRFGSRPEEYLGRDDRVAVETALEAVRPGDRLLLCTDGLTRYFNTDAGSPAGHSRSAPAAPPAAQARGLDRLQQVIARPTADPQALASQLTADGRGEQYEDDTTVVVAEIGASREAPVLEANDQRVMDTDRLARGDHTAQSGTWRLVFVVSLLALVAAGLLWWRPWRPSAAAAPPPFHPYTAPGVDLTGLPRGGLFLMHPETGRLFVLRTHPVETPAADEPLSLRALRVKPGKGLVDTGASYRLDMARGQLTAPGGRAYPVTVDGGSGVIELQQAGTLRVETQPPGLSVLIDGLAAGPTPLRARVRAGHHQVQVRGRAGVVLDSPVEVPPGASITLSTTAPGPGAARARR